MWPEIQEARNRFELKLSGQTLTSRYKSHGNKIDENLFKLVQLNHLEISSIGMISIDTQLLANLENLTSLSLTNNQLTDLGEGLTALTKLKHLDVSRNKLKSLFPPSMPASLETLTATENELEDITVTGILPYLTTLDLRSNKITSFDVSADAAKLRIIVLSDNCLQHLGGGLSILPSLKHLDLSGNQFTEMPDVICSCQKLKEFVAANNPVKDTRMKKLLDQNGKLKTIISLIGSRRSKSKPTSNGCTANGNSDLTIKEIDDSL